MRLDPPNPSDPPGASIVVVLTTVAQRQQAQTLARALVEQRLAACAQIDAIESVYHWDGALQQEPEYRLWLKTTAERVPAAVAALRAQHPYTLPQIVVLAAQASTDYARWVGAQVQP
ncbi:Divalent-cation tolerance protein CutA [Tepidimonas charontis]|uniref:Divalent-cation tolerance protein CutA n=2 Tax=Tepidimonas charontis TaxID=2267262 RepID=A0A554X5E3_9BURK|nr:Divalent-cation tolerance protein CutA [Tepidimonas charontis]